MTASPRNRDNRPGADAQPAPAADRVGAGQARLQALIAVPPDYLKFDMALIRNIHQPPPPARQVLQSLVTMARDLRGRTVAEGIDYPAECEVCTQLGFDLAQGYSWAGRRRTWPRPLNQEAV